MRDEARLWFLFMDTKQCWVRKPSKKQLMQMGTKERQKAIKRYDKQQAELFAAGWKNYREFISH